MAKQINPNLEGTPSPEGTPKLEGKRGIGRNEPLRIACTVLMIALWVADLAVHHSTV